MKKDIDLEILVKNVRLHSNDRAFNKIIAILREDISQLAQNYYIVGQDINDLRVIIELAVWNACGNYSEDYELDFKAYAIWVVAKRAVLTELTQSKAKKHINLNTGISLETPINGDGTTLGATLLEHDLESRALNHIENECLIESLKELLTPMELDVLNNYSPTLKYAEVADDAGLNQKCVDNSLSRIRQKARRL